MPLTPDPDDIVARAFGATVRVHEMTPGELQAAQDRAFNSMTAAVFAFCSFPGPAEIERVKGAMAAYQVAWMQGRERPKPAMRGWERGDHAANRITGKYLGEILSFDMAESGAEAARMSLVPHMVIPLTDLIPWKQRTP